MNDKWQIAVVDDDPAVGRALKRLLTATGHRAKVYCSAEGFLSQPDVSVFDCLVLDINMPGMGGLDLHERLIREGVSLPAVFITALQDGELRRQSRRVGKAPLLRKPFEGKRLLTAIQLAIGASPP